MRFNPYLLETVRMRADEAEKLVTEHGLRPLVDSMRLDASDALHSARELVQIKKILYYTQYPEFMADKLCPVSNKAHTGAKQVGYDLLDPTGKAKVVDDDSQDPPVANIKKEQAVQPVVTIKAAIRWNIQDLREAILAQMSGLSASYSFTEENTRAVLLMMKRKNEDIFVQGDAAYNVPGLLNNSNLTALTVPSTANWVGSSAEDIVGFVNSILNQISTASKNAFRADTMLMPSRSFDHIASLPFSGTSGTATETVLSFILRTRRSYIPNFEIINYPYLEDVQTANTNRVFAYKRDPMVLNQEVPQPMETFGPVTNDGGQSFKVTVRERHAGVQLRYPVACGFAEFTTA